MRTAWPQVLTLAFIVVAAGAACDDPQTAPDPAPAPPGDVVTAADGTRFAVDVVAENLEIPWAMAFAPDGRMFVTERPGRVRVFERGQLLAAPALVLTDVAAVGEGGLLGIAVHPDFAANHFVFLAYTARLAGGSRETRVVRYREVGNTLGEPVVILDRVGAADIHDGARVKFGPDRKLYVTMGDTAAPPTAQDLGTLTGKILRLDEGGTVPADNPFAGSPIFSYGHRNPQGLDWHPVTGEPWGSEHGQTGNDEINRMQPGRNYGWPVFEAVPFDHPLWILFSSGTTGLPKPLVYGHADITIEQMKNLQFHMDVQSGQRMFFYTTTGWMMWNFLVSAPLSGVIPVLYDGSPTWPASDSLWRMAEETGISFFGASPTYQQLLAREGVVPRERFDLSRLESVTLAGFLVTPECMVWFHENV